MSNLIPVEYNNKRILTTKQLAEIYGTEETNIKTNFSNNKNRFKEGIDYYLLIGDDLRKFKDKVNIFNLVGTNAKQLCLWTERGANRHSKILDTDKAWEQFDILEETYFNIKENGKLDLYEEKINSIEDEEERKLTLIAYQCKETLKLDPTNNYLITNSFIADQKLDNYKKDAKIKQLEDKVKSMSAVGNRTEFVAEVNKIARLSGRLQAEIYNTVYYNVKLLFGIDVIKRCENEQLKIQQDRINAGKKPYKNIDQYFNKLDVADRDKLWKQISDAIAKLKLDWEI